MTKPVMPVSPLPPREPRPEDHEAQTDARGTWISRWAARWTALWAKQRWALAGFVAALIGAIGFRAYNLGHLAISSWDEAIHAVVAEHLAEHPLHPTLFETAALTPPGTNIWTYFHTWLHIPPLGMWSAALSMRLLGDNPLAFRLPGLIYVILAMGVVYLLGARLFNPVAGLIGAIFTGFAPYPLLLGQGYVFGDMTDTPLIFFTPLAILALVQSYRSKTYRWLVLAGVCQGLCYLTKSAFGLAPTAVFLALFLSEWTFPREDGWQRLGLRSILVFFGSAVLIAGPYNLYINRAFPAAAAVESGSWSAGFFTSYENWGRPWDFHVTSYLYAMYGPALALLLLAAFLVVLVRAVGWRSRADLVIAAWIAALYLPLSFAVTKAVPFTYAAVPAVGLAVGRLVTLGLSTRWLAARAATLGLVFGTAGAAGMLLLGHLGRYQISYGGTLPPYIPVVGGLKYRFTPYLWELALTLAGITVCIVLLWFVRTRYQPRGEGPSRGGEMPSLPIGWNQIARTLSSRISGGAAERLLITGLLVASVLLLGAGWLRDDLQVIVRPQPAITLEQTLGLLVEQHTPANATVYMTPDTAMQANTNLKVMFWAHRDVYSTPYFLTGNPNSPATLDAGTVCPLTRQAARVSSPLYVLTDQTYPGDALGTAAGWTLYVPAC